MRDLLPLWAGEASCRTAGGRQWCGRVGETCTHSVSRKTCPELGFPPFPMTWAHVVDC